MYVLGILDTIFYVFLEKGIKIKYFYVIVNNKLGFGLGEVFFIFF